MFSRYATHMGNATNPLLLIMGVLGIAFSTIFFLQKFNMMSIAFQIDDKIYLYFFAAFTLIAAIILLFRAIGLASMHYT